MGVGVQLIDSGILSIQMSRIIGKNRKYWITLLTIITFVFGTLFAVTGCMLFIILIINMFVDKNRSLSFFIDILLSIIVFVILVVPVSLRRRKNKI
jgi:amino acid permease